MRLLPGMDGFFYLSFPGKQVYWMVSENGRFESMKQKKEREKEISQWPWISMLPFGILAGYWGKREVRITAISEYGFQARLATPATAEQKNAPWELAFYDQKTAAYQRILLRDAIFLKEKEEDFEIEDYELPLYLRHGTGRLSKCGTAPCPAIRPVYPLENGG